MPRKTVVLVLGLLSVAAVLAAGLVVHALVLKRAATELRDSVASLMWDGSIYANAIAVAEKHRRFRVASEFYVLREGGSEFSFRPNDVCSKDRCVISFEVHNGVLGRIGVVQPAQFDALLVVIDDRVVFAQMTLQGGKGLDAGIVSYTDCCASAAALFRRNSEPYSFPTPYGKRYLKVGLTNAATATQKGRALGLDMRCFLAVRGCDKPCYYLPVAWKDYAAQAAKQRMAVVKCD